MISAFYRTAGAMLVLLSAGVCGAEQGPSDEDKATARKLGQEAQAALKRGDFTAALDLFGRADQLYHAPTLLLGLARSQAALGKLVAAHESYQRLLREELPPGAPGPYQRAQQAARDELEKLAPRVAYVIITIDSPATLSIRLDGALFPTAAVGVKRPLDPGKHELTASAPDRSGEASFEVAEGEIKALNVPLRSLLPPPPPAASAAPPPAPPAPSAAPPLAFSAQSPGPGPGPRTWRWTAGWVSVGVGGTGLLASGLLGLTALSHRTDLRKACQGSDCPTSARPTYDKMRTAALYSDLAGAVGLLGLAVGVPLLLSSSSPRPAQAVAPCLLGGLGVCGAW